MKERLVDIPLRRIFHLALQMQLLEQRPDELVTLHPLQLVILSPLNQFNEITLD